MPRIRWLVLALAACAGPAGGPAPPPSPEPWPQADALFAGDAHRLGGDAVYGVDLGGERILWLFGERR